MTKNVGSTSQPRRPRGPLVLVGIVLTIIVGVMCVLVASWLYNVFYRDVLGGGQQSQPGGEAALPSPLEGIEFPDERIDYPEGWLPEHRYPPEMVLVEAGLGPLMGGGSDGWVMKHRFQGNLQEAAALLTSWLERNGWEVIDQLYLDSGGLVLLVERDNGASGVVNIGPDPSNPDASVIASTLLMP